MFDFTVPHTVEIDPIGFKRRLMEDLRERLDALENDTDEGCGHFGGNSVAALIDGEPVNLWIHTVFYPFERSTVEGVIGVATEAAGTHIRFDIDIKAALTYEVIPATFRPDSRFSFK